MTNEQEIREPLISNTIRLIGEGGFEKATTKAITYSGDQLPSLKMNEAYIYRLFGSKENLYEKAFECLDKEFVFALCRCQNSYASSIGTVKEKLYEFFLQVWRFVLKNEDRCRFYVRYYYSSYFKGSSLFNHHRRFDNIVAGFSPLFKPEAEVRAIMHSVLTTLLDFAIHVYNGDLENNEENVYHIFNLLYNSMRSYLRPDLINT